MGCENRITITRGDTFQGILQLRKKINGTINPYPIPAGATIDLHFPAFDSSQPVVLSTANVGEITIVDQDLSTISFLGSTTKSALLNPGKMQKIDVVITELSGKKFTLTSGEIVYITDRANA